MSVPGPGDASPRATVCRACTTRECCTRLVPLTIAELATIAHTLELRPSSFAELVPAESSPDLAALELPLAHTSTLAPQVLTLRRDRSGACVFLLHLATHRRYCGLGALAPLACRRFPVTAGSQGTTCWRPWTDDELSDPPLDAAQATATAAHAAHVARWHEKLGASHHALTPSLTLDALLSLAAEPPR